MTPLLATLLGLAMSLPICAVLVALARALRDPVRDELEALGRQFDHRSDPLHIAGRCGCHGQSDVAAGPVSTCVALRQECAHKG